MAHRLRGAALLLRCCQDTVSALFGLDKNGSPISSPARFVYKEVGTHRAVWCGEGGCGMKKAAAVVCSLGLALVCTACSPQKPTPPTPNFIAWSQETGPETSPKRVCVLPFTNQTDKQEITGLVRESFAAHFSIKRFVDAELHEIDKELPDNWDQLPARSLGQRLGCQALVYGLVSKASRTYLGLYSGISLDAGILIVDTQTGKSLVEESYSTRFRSGGLPLSLISAVPSVILNLRTMTREQMVRAVDDLARHLAAAVPDLPEVAAGDNAAGADGAVSAASAGDAYRVQVAAFRSSSGARHAVQLLHDEGYQPQMTPANDTENPWYRVVIGPFPSAAKAQQISFAIQQALPFSPVVKMFAAR